jgi:uncharacterized protein (TIGR02246 family)
MSRFFPQAILMILIALSSTALCQDRNSAAAKSAPNLSTDESKIHANVDAFVKAYNARDAKALAPLFAPEAQVVDEEGKTTQGRDAIEKSFAAVFADEPQAHIRVDVESIRFIGSALAIETGRANVIPTPGEAPDVTQYTVVHVKSQSGQWRMGFVRDTKAKDIANREELKPLEWMIGDWVDESPESIATTSCKWGENRNFILQDVRIRRQGGETMHVSQRIGWDPLRKQIRSLLFDSEGGYGESYWTRDGDRWLVKATAVRRDGTTASMTNIFQPTGKDSYTWRSTERVLGDDVMPPVEIKVVRKAPDAALSK